MDFSIFEDTIVAPATTPGTGAITVIRLSGPQTFSLLDKTVSFRRGNAATAKGYTIKSGVFHTADRSVLDDVLVFLYRAPHSYTGEDAAEISCHASAYIASELVSTLCSAGARIASPGEFTRRAFLNGKMDLAQAEVVADIISSTDAASLRVAMHQLRGGYSARIGELRDALLHLSSLVELELDFSEEDVEFANRAELSSLLSSTLAEVRALADSFRLGNVIKNGVPVAIVGPVNAGKSTLLNALVGEERVIVSDVPGTTRDFIEEAVVIGGTRFRFIDTAGLRKTADKIEQMGIERSLQRIDAAEIVLVVLDISASFSENAAVLSSVLSRLDPEHQKGLILLNKSDKIDVNKSVSIYNDYVSCVGNKFDVMVCSAIEAQVAAKVGNWLASCREGLYSAPSDQILVTNERHHSALLRAADALSDACTALQEGRPTDLLAEDLNAALTHLGTITGAVTSDDILTEIFSRFCIGK